MRRTWIATAAIGAMLASSPASADTVTDWWEVANRYYNAAQGSPGPLTPEIHRASTRAALAMFEALNAIDRRYRTYLNVPAGDAAASGDAAAATAAYKVLLQSYPANKAPLDESYALAMAGIKDERARETGRAIGEQAAQAALASILIDPAVAQTPYRPRTIPGQWIGASLPSLEPYWRTMKPWVVPSPDALRPPPPPPLDSELYARDYEEIRRLGGRDSKERTSVQTLIARYRQAFDVTPSVRLATDAPGRPPVDNARLLALYQMAFDDAVQAMAVAKLHYDYWRPITAIRNGDGDGNAATQPDPNWTPLLPTPNFQEYPCGHCTVAAAIAEVMKSESGWRPSVGVRVGSLLNPNSVEQVLPSWDEWVKQVSDSRIYGGVHYRFSNEAGEEIGRRAARMVIEKAMRPLPRTGKP
ncbi:MAG: vanadium-dependent haloperoxidase [Pseudomonadota bacterium]|nr:vanadium-dependent haloperoxidase [Pseudomonadota bacterium]